MRRARKRSSYVMSDPFKERVDRDPCYQVSPYQAVCWRDAWDDLSPSERHEMISRERVPGLITTFGPEIVHRLSADPLRPIATPGPGAALRQQLHLMTPIPPHAYQRCRFNPKLAATVAIGIVREVLRCVRTTSHAPDIEKTATQRKAAEDLGLAPQEQPDPDEMTRVDGMWTQAQKELEMHGSLKDAVASATAATMPAGTPDVWTEAPDDPANANDNARSNHGTAGEPAAPQSGRPLTIASMLGSHPEIRRVLELAGRIAPIIDRLADDKRARQGAGRSRLENTKEVSRLTMLERANLAGIRGGIVAADTFRRVLEGSALGYTGEDPRGRGPIVVCLDQSGSMYDPTGHDDTGPIYGTNDWAQAVALTLMTRAARSGRRVAIVHYDGDVDPKTIRAFARRPTADAVIRAVRLGEDLRGGTSWLSGLTASLDVIQYGRDRGWGSADIVHVTDGYAGRHEDPEPVMQRAASLNVRIHGIAIGRMAESIAGNPDSPLAKWSHTICAVSDVSHDSAAVQALGRL